MPRARSRENEFERKARLFVEEHGGQMTKVIPMVVGWPDRHLFLRNGKSACVEFKRLGERPSPIQIERMKWLNNNGHVAFWVDNMPDFIAAHAALLSDMADYVPNRVGFNESAKLGSDR